LASRRCIMTNRRLAEWVFGSLLFFPTLAPASPPPDGLALPPASPLTTPMSSAEPMDLGATEPEPAFLQTDHAFDTFIGPLSHPGLAQDPRALTEARLLFVQNHLPNAPPLGGDLQLYGLQVRVALTDRLSFIADKDGYAFLRPRGGPSRDGWVNVAAGLKYAF